MTRDRSIIIALICVIIALLISGGTIELLGAVLLTGLILGALVGAAFVYGEAPRNVEIRGEANQASKAEIIKTIRDAKLRRLL